MKRSHFICWLAPFLFALGAAGQDPLFVNNGIMDSPPDPTPQIDAITVVNNGTLNINNLITSTNLDYSYFNVYNGFGSVPLFEFSDMLYFTNRGAMACDTGFRFDNEPSNVGLAHQPSASFVNANPGIITAGSSSNFLTAGLVLFRGGGGSSTMRISATNVSNTGTLDVGLNGLLAINGDNLNLRGGLLKAEGLDDVAPILDSFGFSFDIGIFSRYWGVGHQTNQPPNYTLPSPFSSFHFVTNQLNQGLLTQVVPPNVKTFAWFTSANGGSNNFTQVVLLGGTNSNIATDVRLLPEGPFGVPFIQWLYDTNLPGLGAVHNELYLSDSFGVETNLQTITNSFTLTGQPTQVPFNYNYYRAFPFTGFTFSQLSPPNIPYDPTLLFPRFVTNDYAGYGVALLPVTSAPDPTLPTSNFTNTPGRIEITAGNVLDLAGARVIGPNYLLLNCTNHFAGSPGAQIVMPNADIILGVTNGSLTSSNLVAPVVPRFTGNIYAWSTRWTNVIGSITNQFHVLMVDAELSPTTPPLIRTLNLVSRTTANPAATTNLVTISDVLDVTTNFTIVTDSLVITSNAPGAPTLSGEINLLSTAVLGGPNLPNLRNLTNSGRITTLNSVYWTNMLGIPYTNFINHGTLSSAGEQIWANYFENTASGIITTNASGFTSTNSAIIATTFGNLSVTAGTAVLTNGSFSVVSGDMIISADNLTVSNHNLSVGNSLTLNVNSNLNASADGSGRFATNLFQVGDGFNLPSKPSGDLLGTTISSVAPAFLQVGTLWAGLDLGDTPAGFSNNAAVGHLILDGLGSSSSFAFRGAGVTNALYVDLLELRDYATNRANPDFPALSIAPGMTIYFADARIGNLDISEKMNHANGNQLRWVPSFAGPFSGTNFVYPTGQTNFLNRALVQSAILDSDGDGIPNAFDPTPLFLSQDVGLTVGLTAAPAPALLLSWHTLLNATNHLEFTTSLTSPVWQPAATFVTNINTLVSRQYPATNSSAFYRVRIDPQQP